MLSGEKGLEIRKTAPNCPKPTEVWPLTVLVYVSGTGAVHGEFTCPGYVKTNMLAGLHARACLSMSDLVDYAGGHGRSVCAWAVKEPQAYDAPRPLAEFGLKRPPMSWQYIEIPDAVGGTNGHFRD